MFNKFATEKQICETLAAFKMGDVITILEETTINGEGIVDAGTQGRITGICIKNGVKIPEITANDVNNYYANSDKYVFVYEVTIDNGMRFDCTADEIERGTVSAEGLDSCKDKKRIMYRDVAIVGSLQKALLASFYPLGVIALALLVGNSMPCGIEAFFSKTTPMVLFSLLFWIVTICGITFTAKKPLGCIRRKRRKEKN